MLLERLQEVVEEGYLAVLIERCSGLINTAPLKVRAVTTGAFGLNVHASRASRRVARSATSTTWPGLGRALLLMHFTIH